MQLKDLLTTMTEVRTVCFIGAGNVATHLAKAFHNAGFMVNGIFSRHIEHAQTLAEQVGASVAVDNLSLLPFADVYMFSVKDSVLSDVAKNFYETCKNPKALFIHTAGSMSLSVLSDFFENVAVFYPMQTFSKNRTLNFREIPVFVEANDPQNLREVMYLAKKVSMRVTTLSSERRKKLHLSAVFACNFSNHCFNLAYNVLQKEGIDPTCLLGLIDETVAKIHDFTPHEAQTGPAVRWDENVMNSQIEQLVDSPEMQAVYQIMSESIRKEFSCQ